jgi:hypothetical protein
MIPNKRSYITNYANKPFSSLMILLASSWFHLTAPECRSHSKADVAFLLFGFYYFFLISQAARTYNRP